MFLRRKTELGRIFEFGRISSRRVGSQSDLGVDVNPQSGREELGRILTRKKKEVRRVSEIRTMFYI